MGKNLSIIVVEKDRERALMIVDGLREAGDFDIVVIAEEAGLARRIAFTIIPGVTAACAAAASAQSFLTERGRTERVILATGHRRAGEVTDWAATAAPGTTLALYMGVSSAAELQAGLMAEGWPATALVEVISKAQTAEERVLRGYLGDLSRLCQSERALNPAILLIRWSADLAPDAVDLEEAVQRQAV